MKNEKLATADKKRVFMTCRCCLVAALLLFSVSWVFAEETVSLSGKVGKWTFSMSEASADTKKLGSGKLAAIRSNLQEISRVITSTPAMKPLKGFEARFWGSIAAKDRYDACTGKNCPSSRPAAVLAMLIGRYEEKDGKIRAAFNNPSAMDISINNLGQVFAHLPVLYRDSQGYMLPEPKQSGERAGMTAYLNNGRMVAVIAARNRPLWLPVSRERYLKAAIETAGKLIGLSLQPVKKMKSKKTAETEILAERHFFVEEGRTWIDPADEKVWFEQSRSVTTGIKEDPEKVKERIQLLQKELEALTPEQRTMQARIDASSADSSQAPLLPADRSDGVGVVTPDFAYFSKKIAAEVPQLLTVQWKFSGNHIYDPEQSGISEHLNNQKLLEIYKDVDWGRLISKISQTAP